LAHELVYVVERHVCGSGSVCPALLLESTLALPLLLLVVFGESDGHLTVALDLVTPTNGQRGVVRGLRLGAPQAGRC
jgi:hypothetical protein